MQIPRFVWNKQHNVASFAVSYSTRIWHTRDAGDAILGFNASGRLARVVVLNPNELFPDDADLARGLALVTRHLETRGVLRRRELDVLRSALERAEAMPSQPPIGRFLAS